MPVQISSWCRSRMGRFRGSTTLTRPTVQGRQDRRGSQRSRLRCARVAGGVGNRTRLRTDENAVEFVHEFFEQGKPVGAICHAPWLLIEAGVVRDRTLTSWPSLTTDLRNAGANHVDQEVVVDRGLVTSRKPDDIPAFSKKLIEEFAEGRHEPQAAKSGAAS